MVVIDYLKHIIEIVITGFIAVVLTVVPREYLKARAAVFFWGSNTSKGWACLAQSVCPFGSNRYCDLYLSRLWLVAPRSNQTVESQRKKKDLLVGLSCGTNRGSFMLFDIWTFRTSCSEQGELRL